MRLLMLSVSGRLGGAERVLADVVAVTRAARPAWRVDVVSLEEGPLRAAVERLGAGFTVAPPPAAFAGIGEYGGGPVPTVLRLAAAAPGLAAYTRRLRRHLLALEPDIVHANGLKAHVLSAWTAPTTARLVWHVHDYVGSRAISSVLFRRYAGRTAAIVANSASVAADVERVAGRSARVLVVHNGVDVGRFAPAGPALDLDAAAGLPAVPAGTVRVGLVATYAKWKGHETFLRAVARLDRALPVRAYVTGGAVYQTRASQWSRDELEALATALGLSGRIGFVDFQPDPAPVYRALDVVVHASTAAEPFGLVIAEAMACGRAVVASDAGGAREIGVPEGTHLVHRPGDAGDLARQIDRLARDGTLRRRLGEAAVPAIGERFTIERMGAALHAIYETL